jgi:hypothetical protein
MDRMAWTEKFRRLDERVVPRPLNSRPARRGRSRLLLVLGVLVTVLALPFAIIRDDWSMLAVPLGLLTGALLAVALSPCRLVTLGRSQPFPRIAVSAVSVSRRSGRTASAPVASSSSTP